MSNFSSFPGSNRHGYSTRLLFFIALGLLLQTGPVVARPAAGADTFRFEARDISGRVTDENGEALVGVSVAVKGAAIGTVTDLNGDFTLRGVDENATIVFSYTGYATQEIVLGSSATLSVVLLPAITTIEQVVVVGYGTERRKTTTNAVSRVDGEQLAKQPYLSATQGLQGLAPGIQVIGSGAPGTQPRVQIRGVNTILTNENPLYVVDGVLTDDITNVNVADIVSIDVLKDGAAAIYGSRAANGVILITTRRGQTGEPRVNFNSYVGYRSLINRVEMADATLYATYTNEARAYDMQPALFALDTLRHNTDWFDEITQNGIVQNYNLGVSGGSEHFTYLFNAGFFSDEGVLKGANFSRVNLRGNNEYKVNDWFKLGNVLNVNIYRNDGKPVGAFTDAYRAGPTAPVRDSRTDNYGFTPGLSVANPVAALELTNEQARAQRFQGNLYGEVKILPDLTFRSSWGFDRIDASGQGYSGVYRYGIFNQDRSELRLRDDERFYWVLDNVLSWVTSIGDDNVIRLTLGQTAERDRSRFSTIRAADVPEDENLWYIGQGDPTSVVTTDGGALLRRQSYFGRVNYSYQEKYNLSAILRRDGSSAFPVGQKWGTFYAVSGAWILTEENFLADGPFDYLKLRGGYAEMGNDGISRIVNNELSQLISVTQTNPYGFPNGLAAGITYDQVRDALASWETTTSTDIGLEFVTANNRLSGELGYYNKLTNAYIRVPTPPFVDVNGILSQAADVRNSGIEAMLTWSNQTNRDFGYRIGVNATFNRNVVENVRGGIDLKEGGLGNGEVTTSTVAGEPIGSFWVYETDGIYQSQAEIDASPHFTGTLPGDFRYRDVNGDSTLDERDRVFVGSYQPKMYYGVNFSLTWKDFDFSIDGYGTSGGKIYNGKKGVRFGNDNIEASRVDRWTPENPNNNEPRASNSIPKPSTYFVESANFFRINNISLGYNLMGLIKDSRISTARIYVSAQNPVLFKKFSGFSPELPGSNALNSGIELYVYPTLATYLVGVNASF